MHLRALRALVAVALLSAAATVASAQQPAPRASIAAVSDAAFPTVEAVVNFEDPSGGEPAQLGPADFRVLLDGKPAPVVAASLASSERSPLDVLMALDTSGSMEGVPMAQAKAAAVAFIAALDPSDRVAVMHFGDSVELTLDYTTDRAAATAAIEQLQPLGNTALYQATSDAARKAAASPASRRAIVLLGDGADFGGRSVVSREAALADAAASGVPFFTVALGADLDRAYLQQIAEGTNGRYLEAPTPGDLSALYAGIGRLLRSQYTVTFDASAVGVDALPLSIEMTVGGATVTATGTYSPSVAATPPTIVIEGLQAGDAIREPRAVTLITQGGRQVTRVAFHVDGVNVYETTTPPFTYTFDPAAFVDGEHTLSATAESGLLQVTSDGVAFSSNAPALAVGGGLPLVKIAFAVCGGGVLLVLVAGFLRPKKRRDDAPLPVNQRITPWAHQIRIKQKELDAAEATVDDSLTVEIVREPLGVLIARGGSDAGREYLVGGKPVSVGSNAACAVRIDDPDLAHEEARIWVRNGHLMVHRMTRLALVANETPTGGWSILDQGDTLEVGSHTFEFRLLPEAAAGGDAGTPPGIADVLRDREAPAGDSQAQDPAPLRLASLMPRDHLGNDADRRAG